MIPNITMIDSGFDNCTKLDNFLRSSKGLAFSGGGKKAKYELIKEVLGRVNFRGLEKKERGTVREYLSKVTGYSTSQLTRLISKYLQGSLRLADYQRHKFTTRFSPADIALLLKTDNLHLRLNGRATKAILIRECLKFGHSEYENISKISVSHIYNLRQTRFYTSHSLTFTHTQAVQRNIGERRKPDPQGKPGYLRVDTVHQGDLDKEKGVYHINLVDEVTQWEILVCVDSITEESMAYVLHLALGFFPFIIAGFHSDNGGENINGSASAVLQKLLIEQTKSRSGRCNDNALIESKNGSVIRKHMGHWHIPKYEARKINGFYRDCFNEFLCFNRMCAYPTTIVLDNGKKKKVYEDIMTPVQKLLSIPNVERYLKEDVTIESLKEKMTRMSHLENAKIMHENKQKLFAAIKKC